MQRRAAAAEKVLSLDAVVTRRRRVTFCAPRGGGARHRARRLAGSGAPSGASSHKFSTAAPALRSPFRGRHRNRLHLRCRCRRRRRRRQTARHRRATGGRAQRRAQRAGRAGRCDGHAIRQGATNARCASPPLQLVRRRRAQSSMSGGGGGGDCRGGGGARFRLESRKPAMCRAYLRVPPSAESAQWLFDSGADAREAGSRRLKCEVWCVRLRP